MHRFRLSRSHHPRQIRAPCRALIAHIASLLLRTVGSDLGEEIHHLAVRAALLDQARHGVATLAPALVAGNLQHAELADQGAEDDRAAAGNRCGAFAVVRD